MRIRGSRKIDDANSNETPCLRRLAAAFASSHSHWNCRSSKPILFSHVIPEEVQALFERPCWLDRRSNVPEQFLAVGWVGECLYSVIFEVREDDEGEALHLVTLWKSTREEVRLYEENS